MRTKILTSSFSLKKIIQTIFLIIVFLHPRTVSAVTVTDIMPEDLYTWYTTNAWAAPNATYFGAWSIQPYQDKLYLGLASHTPRIVANGAMLASFDGSSLAELGDVFSRGLKGMRVSGDRVFIPGLDPTNGELLDAGDLYMYDIGDATFTQLRFRESSYQYVDATTTDADGNYSFTGLKPTSYQVKFVKPADYAFSTALVGSPSTNGAIDSNPATGTGLYTICATRDDHSLWFTKAWTDDTIDAGIKSSPGSAAYTPTEGTKDMDYFTGNYTIGSRVWIDTDSDGLQDSGELGIAGVRVELYSRDPYFPCIISNVAIHVEDNGQTIYYDGQVYGYNGTTDTGHPVFKSTDGGSTWSVVRQSQVYDPSDLDASDTYWAEDINRFNGYLYLRTGSMTVIGKSVISGTDYLSYNTSWVNTTNDDTNWLHTEPGANDFGFAYPSGPYTVHLTLPILDRSAESFIFRNGLIMPHYRGTKLRKYTTPTQYVDVTVSGMSFTQILPNYNDYNALGTDYQWGIPHHWQSFSPAADEYAIAIDDQNKLFASTSLRNWTELADFETVDSGADAITVSYWPSEEKVIVGTVGSTGSVYSIPLSDVEGLFTKISNSTSLTFNDMDETGLNLETIGNTGTDISQIRHNNYLLSEIDTTFAGATLDWTSVNGEVDVTNGKSIVLNLVTAPGAATTHTLYVPITGTNSNDSALRICPNANTLAEVSLTCPGGVVFTVGETKDVNGASVTATKITFGGLPYWKADGVNGTGGISTKIDTSPAGAPICTNSPPTATPKIISASADGKNSIVLSFTDSSENVDYYTLEYGEEKNDYKYGATNIGGKGTTTYQVKELKSGTTYYFRIRGSNGCATGVWSNEIAAKTLGGGGISTITGDLEIVSSELVPITTTDDSVCKTHSVVSGDSLWSIARELLGDGNRYKELIELNKEKYPALLTSERLEIGWELKTDCPVDDQENQAEGQEYSVNVKVINTKGQPVKGAKVTIHSKVQEAKTDENGVAMFSNIEEGDHKVIIAYNGYEGEQNINLTGDVNEFNLNITIEAKSIWTSPQFLISVGTLSLVILILSVLLIRTKRKH